VSWPGEDIHIHIRTDPPVHQHIHASHNTRSNPNPHRLTTPIPGSQFTASDSPRPFRQSESRVGVDASIRTRRETRLPGSFKPIPGPIQEYRPTFSLPIPPTLFDYQHVSQPVVPSPRVTSLDHFPLVLPKKSSVRKKSLTYAYATTVPAQAWHSPSGHSPATASLNPPPSPTPPQERCGPRYLLPPPLEYTPLPGTYSRVLRWGIWNRRGDHLTLDKHVVYPIPGCENPRELEDYPLPTEGYKDHYGNFIKYDPTHKELPDSLPRDGKPPKFPYKRVCSVLRHPHYTMLTASSSS